MEEYEQRIRKRYETQSCCMWDTEMCCGHRARMRAGPHVNECSDPIRNSWNEQRQLYGGCASGYQNHVTRLQRYLVLSTVFWMNECSQSVMFFLQNHLLPTIIFHNGSTLCLIWHSNNFCLVMVIPHYLTCF